MFVKIKVHRVEANTGFSSLYDHIEPSVNVSMPVIKDPAPHTQSHTSRQERVKIKLSHPVFSILPSVFGLVVLEAEPFERSLSR